MKKYRICAFFLCLCLAFSLVTGVFAAGDEIHISTASQLRELAEKCRLDTWSVGKTVVLDADIDLGGVAFEPIPSFGGTFQGGGHTISGLAVENGGSGVGGLFRYVQSGGEIRDLNVSGVAAPRQNAQSFGGIAGENSGTIIGCSFSGAVSGKTDIGGIVGVNMSGGVIEDCRSLAAVSGEHYTGGIAGRNLGSIVRCTNLGPVNTTNPEVEGEVLEIDWEKLNSTENLSAHTDTGGITGFSQGSIEGCVNRGSVGYPHVGYNVGGIAGRQSGFIGSCRNLGAVNGRKDVGGVVGQMVPDIRIQFSGTKMEELRAEMTVLQELLDGLISDTQDSSNEISGILDRAGGYLDSAVDSAGALTDAIADFIDGNVDAMNSIIGKVEKYMGRLESVMGSFEECFRCLSAAGDDIAALIKELPDGEEYPEIYEKLSYAAEKLDEAADSLSQTMDIFREVAGELEEFFNSYGGGNAGEALDEFLSLCGGLSGKLTRAVELAGSALDSLNDGIQNGLMPALEQLSELMAEGELSKRLEAVIRDLAGAAKALENASGELERLLRDINNEDFDSFEKLGGSFREEADRMDAGLAALGGEMDKLNRAMNSSVNLMGEDLRLVNQQFFKVMDLFLAMLDSSGVQGEIYQDMSEEEIFAATRGKVQKSENRGDVAGDVNTGGLVGTIAIEYDLDPEEDISVSGSSGTFRYYTSAVLLDSVNFESVSGKKDCVGGAVGYMDLGVVYGCENYGSVSSASGDYVGGIAGQSASTLRNCWSLCSLSGRDYVGGIAGQAGNLSGCRSLVRIDSTGGWKGAIAGSVDGEAKNNLFVGGDHGGIDGVSYAGKAEPVEYSEFVKLEGLPGEFEDFKLTFATDSMLVESIGFQYGESINTDEIPKVPERVGYVGEWEDYDFTKLTFSDTVMAVYTPFDTVVAVENTVGKRPVLLLEGSFLPGTVPVIVPCVDAPEGSLEAWSMSCGGLVEDSYSLRYLAPGDMEDMEIRVLRDGKWQSAEVRREGSYLVFEGSGENLSFAAVERERSIPVLPFALAGAVLALAVVLIIAKAMRKKKGRH